ncbi:MAG: dTDP-4-dehydrorhamnose 3,5-epimerase [Kiritimatiellia bacterium]|nr:dTDP-4-dehydrorhamnose 3,5-epimerase [Kiritimatiellia bacterium]
MAIESQVFTDDRGIFLETYKRSDFESRGIEGAFVQDNHSRSRKGVVRGLHYQVGEKVQGKLVGVLSGSVWDVAVDLRRSSPTFGQWKSVVLSATEKNLLWIPGGFAHGFLCLSEQADVSYKLTAEYSAEEERGIRWDDSFLSITWPHSDVTVSQRDAALPLWDAADLLP